MPVCNRNLLISFVKKAFTVLAILSFVSGCSYKTRLEPNMNLTKNENRKFPYTLAIDGRSLSRKELTADPGAVKLTVEYGDALLESLKNKLSHNFDNVYIITSDSDIAGYDYVMSIDHQVNGTCGGTSCIFNSETYVSLANNKSNAEILSDTFIDAVQYQQPGSASALGIMTGLTLMVFSPITLPIALQLEGDEFREQVSAANDRIAMKISNAVIRAKF